jgi:hypothetical protein
MEFISIGDDFQAVAKIGYRVIDVALLKIGYSKVLMDQRISGSLFWGALVQRDRFFGFSRLDQREA